MNWTKDFPTKMGHYWFYGWLDRLGRSLGENPKLYLVERFETYSVARGQLIFKSDLTGIWKPAVLPEEPVSTLEELLGIKVQQEEK